jgi:urea transporter
MQDKQQTGMAGQESLAFLGWCTIILRGIGQVIFQGHAGTGLFFLAGIAVGSPIMAAGALLGSALGTALATILRFDRREIADGIYGFNPTLVGVAVLFFLDPGQVLVWVLLAGGCAAATIVCFLMRRFLKFPTYTTPFIVCTWVVFIVAHGMAGASIDHKVVAGQNDTTPHTFVGEVLAGGAEVMFGASSLTGAFFLVGVALSSWRHAVLLFVGSLVGTLAAIYHSDPEGTIAIGIYGYNAALAAVAVYLWRKSLLHPILAAIVAVPLTEFFPKGLSVPALTAPFVVSSWLVIAIGSLEAYICTD